jgi:dTDP-4-amino-4,6-dideoxygalactose transaminase
MGGNCMKVLFGNPMLRVDGELTRTIDAILKSGWVSIGEYVEALEEHFRKLTGVKHAIGTNSATTGLIIAVKAAGWENQTVALPAFTWPSTLYAVKCNGNTPVFWDIDNDTWLAQSCDSKPAEKAIVVDTFGSEFPIQQSKNHKSLIIDAAHGYGLPNLGKRGIAEVVSLSFTEVVTGMEGGMILADDDTLAETATELRRLSGRMGEINAAIALKSAMGYDPNPTQFAVNHYKKHITVPYKCQESVTDTNNSVFSLLFKDSNVRDTIRIALEKYGVETKVYYDPLISGLPNTDDIYRRILSLPTHSEAIEHQDKIIEIINGAGRAAGTPGKRFLTQ